MLENILQGMFVPLKSLTYLGFHNSDYDEKPIQKPFGLPKLNFLHKKLFTSNAFGGNEFKSLKPYNSMTLDIVAN